MTIKEEFLSLLERDKEFRYAVAGLLGLEEILRRLDGHEERMARIEEELARLREDMIAGFKRHDEEIARLREDMSWGLMAEEAFREGVRGLVEGELGFRVERWVKFDGEGFVYGYPSQVEVDVAVHDGRLILVEVRSHVGVSDVYMFRRLAEFYERVEGRKPDRLVMVTPYADAKALEASLRLGVEV